MKKILICALVCYSSIAFSQGDNLPDKVQLTFQTKYPNSKLDNWSNKDELFYFEYYLKNELYTSVFDVDGQWQETSAVISDFDIPVPLKDFCKKNYPEGEILYTEKVEKPNSLNFYRTYLSYEDSEIVLQLNSDGKTVEIIKILNEE
jgi:hypothetical protein